MTTVWDFWIIGSCTFICSRSGESAAVWSGNAANCTASLSAAAESAVAVTTAAAADPATDTTTAAANATVAATAATCESLNLYNLFEQVPKVSHFRV